jgi:effector-binding domain-containing protein
MSHRVQIVQAPAVTLAVVRRRASPRELSTVVPAACGEVWTFIRANHVDGAGRHVAVYLDGAINLEVGVEVPATFAGDTPVMRSATPAGLVATTAHIGPYDRLGDAHGAIRAWCKAHDRALAGPNWEIYGHWLDDPARLRTDVFYLLEPSR